jgi:ATP citrate (pro-S)-lyase
MSARAIWEATGKNLINRNLNYSNGVAKCRFAVYDQSVSWSQLVQQEPWLETEVSD